MNWFVAAAIIVAVSGGFAFAEDAVDPTAVKSEDGKYLDKEGIPTFKVAADGTVDWYTYSGYRRYHWNAMSAMGPTEWARPMRRHCRIRSRP